MSQIEVLNYTMDNPDVLVGLYKNFREIDQALGIQCEVRYVLSIYGGETAGSRAIVYTYPDEVQAFEAQEKRQANASYQELAQKLGEAGFAIVGRSLLLDITPD